MRAQSEGAEAMKRPLWTTWTLVFAIALLHVQCLAANGQEALTFRVGASIGLNGSCPPLYNDTVSGYQYFFHWLENRPPSVVFDASGKAYQLRLQLRLVSHNCTEEGRSAAMSSLINGTQADPTTGAAAQPPVHLLLGGDNALEDALQADAASRLLLHCCTARDSVFHRGLAHVYGLFTPASLYTGTVLRTMALRGMRRVAVVYSRESTLHVQLCEGALAQLPPLGELRPGFSGVLALNYSSLEAEEPGFWADTSRRVVNAGADVLIACDGMNRTSLLVHQLKTRGHRLLALWLASWGNVDEFLHYLDGRGEYALTTVQWMPDLPYADPDFGTAAEYAAAFASANGRPPSYFSAAATASGYVLLTALKQALTICSLGNINTTGGDAADAFMWADGALSCMDKAQHAVDIRGNSGTAILRYVMSALNMDTFFGPVGFNTYRQNIFHPVIVTQVLNGDLVTVLPLDVADRALVMPIPDNTATPAPTPWPQTKAGISIIALLCCLGLVCVALGVLMCVNRVSPHAMTIAAVDISQGEIKVDIAPALNADGSFEPGEGVYRGTRVKLVVASELMVAAGAGATPNPLLAGRSLREHGMTTFGASPSGTLEDRELSPPPQGGAVGDLKPPPAQRSQPQVTLSCPATTNTTEERRGHSRPQLLLELTEGQGCSPGGGYGKQCIGPESGLQSTSSSTVAGPPVQQVGGSGSATRWSLSAPLGALPKRNRRQIQALVWRAVRLQHPRMCPVLGIVWEWPGLLPASGPGDAGGRVPVLVRQWHEFDNLDHLLENETVPLPLLTKAHIAQGVAEGLAYLHAQDPPILAGPLDASRVIIDKNFNPHLFLRLRNLDPEYGAVSDSSRTRTRGVSIFTPLPAPSQQRLLSASTVSASQLPSPLLPQEAQSGHTREPSTPRMQWASYVGSATAAALPGQAPSPLIQPQQPQDPRLQPVMTSALPSVAVSVASGVNSGNTMSQAAADILFSFSRLGGAFITSTTGAGGTATSTGAAAPPTPLYRPSKQQDVYEFGLLLCNIFMVSSSADSGWLRFALNFTHVPGTEGPDAGVTIMGSGGGAGVSTAPPTASQLMIQTVATAAQPAVEDDCSMRFALSYLRSICPELADLAQSCLRRDPDLTFHRIVHELEARVLPALAGAGDSQQAPASSRRNQGLAGGGGGHGGLAATLVTRGSGDAAPAPSSAPRSPVGRAAEANCVRASAGSMSRVEMLKGGRSHHAILTPDDLIYDFFPPKVARALQAGESVQPERYECVSIFFSDVVGYTDLCGKLQPFEVMDLMHRLYSLFDDIIRELGLFKVETVGDAYLAVGNLRWPQPDDHARLMAQFAMSAVRAANSLSVHPDRPDLGCVHVRVGLHCGPVVGSVVGTLNRRYCLFGDAVNTAARMEHNSKADKINCSAAFAALLREQWPDGARTLSRGVMPIKGKGAMELFWLVEGDQVGPQPGGNAQQLAELPIKRSV